MSGISDGVRLLRYLQYSTTFPDFPKNFTLPALTDPNYVPPNRATGLLEVCYLAAVVSTLVVSARLYVRRFSQMKFGWDDWLIIPALMFTLSFIAIEIVLVQRFGIGRHIYDIDFSKVQTALVLEFAAVLLYYSSAFFTKMSIVAFLYRLFDRASPSMIRILHVTTVFYVLLYLSSIIAYSAACRPAAANWDIAVKLDPGSKCVNIPALVKIMCGIYVVGDVWLLALPLFRIWNLKVPTSMKIGLCCVMSLGGVACIGAVLKLVYIDGLYNSFDPTCAIWGSLVEVSAGIISASLPSLSVIIASGPPKRIRAWISSVKGSNSTYLSRASGQTGQSRRKSSVIAGKKAPQISQLSMTKWELEVTQIQKAQALRYGSQDAEMDLEKGVGRSRMGSHANGRDSVTLCQSPIDCNFESPDSPGRNNSCTSEKTVLPGVEG